MCFSLLFLCRVATTQTKKEKCEHPPFLRTTRVFRKRITSFSSNTRAKNRYDALFSRREEKLFARFYVVTNAACDAVKSRVVFFFVL